MAQAADKVDDKQINRVEAIINSMTPYEREHHRGHQRQPAQAHRARIRVERAKSISCWAYAQMRKMFKTMGSQFGGGLQG